MDDDELELVTRLFKEGRNYEVIVTTVGNKGKGPPNAAALGVVRKGDKLRMRVFEGSNTFQNLRGLRRLGINIVDIDGIHLLARAALHGYGDEVSEFSDDEFENRRGFPFIKAASVQLDCNGEDWTESYGTDEYGEFHIAKFDAEPKRSYMNDDEVVPIERGSLPVLEAMVFASRWSICEGELKEFHRKRVHRHLDEAREQGGDANLRAIRIVEDFLKDQ